MAVRFGAAIVLATLIAIPAMAEISFESSCPQTIAEGDTFTIHGTGATNGSITLLVLGRQYFHTFTVDPDSRGSFTITVGPGETRNFSAGQYAFVIQDPGANGQYEIDTHISRHGNITVMNRGAAVTDLGTAGDLKPWVDPEIEKLMAVSGREGVDDIFRVEYFFVELPSLHFDQQNDPKTGRLILNNSDLRRIEFSGTTNMAPGNALTVRIVNATSRNIVFTDAAPAIIPAYGTEPGRNSYWNTWYYSLDPAQLSPGEYVITVGWEKETWCGTASVLFLVPDAATSARPDRGPYLFSLAGSSLLAGL